MRAINQSLTLFDSITFASYFHCRNSPRFVRNTMSGSNQAQAFDRIRSVIKKVAAKSQREGDGAIVRRAIGT